MRLTRHITLILALLLGATPGARGAADWSWSIDASTAQEGWFTGGEFGARATTLDGFDTKDLLIQPGIRAYIGTYHETGLGDWTGPTGFFRRDLRAPWSSASPILIWDIGVWMDPSVPSQADFIKVGWTRSTQTPAYLRFTLQLVQKPQGVTGGPAVGATWNLLDFTVREVTLPAFSTADGNEGYLFRLMAVPEPSGLLALAGGMSGLLALSRRRRGAG